MTHMAAIGIRSSGAGLETVPFKSPVPARGRLELWVKDLDRQLVSAIARDVELTLTALVAHGKVGGPGRPPLLQVGIEIPSGKGIIGMGDGDGGQSNAGTASSEMAGGSDGTSLSHLNSLNDGSAGGAAASPTMATPGKTGGAIKGGENCIGATNGTGGGNNSKSAGRRHRPSVQGHLLARSAHWTAAVEAAFSSASSSASMGPTPGAPPSLNSSAPDSRASLSVARPESSALKEIITSLLLYIDGWAGELRQPGGTSPYFSVSNTALMTQALHQRDVVDALLKASYLTAPTSAPSEIGARKGTSATPQDSATTQQPSLPKGSRASDGTGETPGTISPSHAPFSWLCHVRHYHVSPAEAALRTSEWERVDGVADADSREHNSRDTHNAGLGGYGDARGRGGGGGEDYDLSADANLRPPPPPLIRVGLGPWDVPYGFEYAGTMERLWLTPLSERCLLHAVYSAKVRHIKPGRPYSC